MIPRRRRILVGLALAVVGVPALLGLVLFLINPQTATLLALRLLYPLLANTKPPAMFADQIVGTSASQQEISRQLTARLQQEFPLGTKEERLRSTLLAQGFRPPPAPPENCVQPVENGKARPPEKGMSICPPQDPARSLQYRWSFLVCSSTITVRWSTDDRDTVTLLDGHYHSVCV